MNAAEVLNAMTLDEARRSLEHCCATSTWIDGMLSCRPFEDFNHVKQCADQVASKLSRQDWLEAFAAHPRIGDVDSLRAKYAATKQWASNEQAGVNMASDEVIVELARCNDLYFDRFGYIFIVCATGKSAREMLDILKGRLNNDDQIELEIAASEQQKITLLRLEKLAT
jgi:OHCU decarboxylase